MANIGQTLFRLTAALSLAAGATAVDNPRVIAEATLGRRAAADAPVVIATVDIPDGSEITPGAVAVVKWPVPVIPPGAYSSAESVVGSIGTAAVFKGEALVPGRLTQRPSDALDVRITPGKRAYAIRVDDVSGIAGIIRPSSRVDILVTIDTPIGERRQRMSKIFMSNVRVLAIGGQVQRGADGPAITSHVATLELSPEEFEKLAIAANQGSISLALRGYGDPQSVTTNGALTVPAVEYFPKGAALVPRPRPR